MQHGWQWISVPCPSCTIGRETLLCLRCVFAVPAMEVSGRNLLRLWTALHPFLLLAPRRGMLLGRKSYHKGSSAVEENALSLCIFVNLWVLAASIMKQIQLASLNGCRMRDLFPLPVLAQPGQPVAAVVGMQCHYVSTQVVSETYRQPRST